jgi:hypothetical protein
MILFFHYFGKEFRTIFCGNIMETFGNQNSANSATIFHCEFCDYNTIRKCNYATHINSLKHQKNAKLETFGNQNSANSANSAKNENKQFICNNCDKHFKYRSGLWKHKNKCLAEEPISSNMITTELVLELIKDNKELQNIIVQQNNTINNIVDKFSKNEITNNINTNSNNNTNSHNKAFNLNVFLNETCKEAINISDFVNSIKVSFEDLENTGRKGYIDGISNIITKNLKNLEEHNRPIHCSDFKREIIYIKDNNEWTKETDNKPILTKAIKVIANENIKQIKGWREKYPDCTEADSKKNNMYLKIVSNSMNGITEEEGQKNISKIITNVSKETIIQKENYV